MDIETDYLVVGAGASGLAFADSLLAEADVDVVLVDRREHPGGHWRDAYPFVRLHSPSAFYGVNSMPLGHDRLIESGRNAGFYEQAERTGDLCVLRQCRRRPPRTNRPGAVPRSARPSRRRRHGAPRFVICAPMTCTPFSVRRRVVDAAYLETSDTGHARALVHRGSGGQRSFPSTPCRTSPTATSSSPSSEPGRPASTPVCGCSTTAWTPTGSAGCALATCGSTIAPSCNRSTRWRRPWRASPATQRRPRKPAT